MATPRTDLPLAPPRAMLNRNNHPITPLGSRMFGSSLKAEIWRILAITGAGLMLGFILGKPILCLAITWGLCLVWLLVQMRRLQEWLRRVRLGVAVPHDLSGVWGELSHDVQRLLMKHEKEKQRLQSVIQKVQNMTGALTDAVILTDKRHNIDWWNPAAERLLAFRASDRGQHLSNLIRHPKFVQYFDAKDYSIPLELAFWQKNQFLEIQVHAYGEGERLVIARDITRLYKLERMRKDFVANVSHELRTPLTIILGYIETFIDAEEMPRHWRKAFAQINQQCARMTALTNDLLTLTKLETENRGPDTGAVALAPIAETVMADARALSGDRDHKLFLRGDRSATVTGSAPELRSALTNLVVNAINYSPPGAEIEITLEQHPEETVLKVTDAGIGIDPQHLPRLTERFYRVDPSRSVASGGTGLGLAIVKHILLRHHGELRVSSQPGKGSEFACHFPRSKPHSPRG